LRYRTATYAYGGYADIDRLFREQATELDKRKREAMLHRIQQLLHEKAMFAPIWELVALQWAPGESLPARPGEPR
jgi:ABC-type transport system substrate-binding protein